MREGQDQLTPVGTRPRASIAFAVNALQRNSSSKCNRGCRGQSACYSRLTQYTELQLPPGLGGTSSVMTLFPTLYERHSKKK